ncbi:MAG: hypothetical protein C0467_29265 [Planctomycetaceae bacterium]|nr:hypothetical protein [Planctomycetaceae bacterium]
MSVVVRREESEELSSTCLVVASPDEAHDVALDFSTRRWPSLSIDPYDTALHVLVAHLTSRTLQEVFASLHDLTPKLEGAETAEPWDERFWVACVHQLPDDYITAVVNIQDNAIPAIVAWWYGIEELTWSRRRAHNFTEQAVGEDFRRIRDFLGAAAKQSVLMRLST